MDPRKPGTVDVVQPPLELILDQRLIGSRPNPIGVADHVRQRMSAAKSPMGIRSRHKAEGNLTQFEHPRPSSSPISARQGWDRSPGALRRPAGAPLAREAKNVPSSASR